MEATQYKIPSSEQTDRKGDLMEEPDEVATMLRLQKLGRGVKGIAKELGVSKNTVRHYLRRGGWAAYHGQARPRALAGHGAPSLGRRRRNAPGTGPGEGDRGFAADGGAGGGDVSPGTGGAGAGDGALRDAAGSPDADRLRQGARERGRSGGRGFALRGDRGLLTPDLRQGLPCTSASLRGWRG